MLTSAALASALQADSGRSFVYEGVLITRQPAIAVAAVTFLPRPHASSPFRMLFLYRDGSLALVQRCVDPVHETIEAVDFRPFQAGGRELIMAASARWLYYSEKGSLY